MASKNNPNNSSEDEDEHKIIPSVDNPESTNQLELIPKRLKIHTKYLVAFKNKVKCTACSDIFHNEIRDILNHLTHQKHFKWTNIPLPHFKYNCDICAINFNDERTWLSHVGSSAHITCFNRLGDTRKKLLMEYECLKCSVVIYGDKISLMRHEEPYTRTTQNRRHDSNVTMTGELKKLLVSVQKVDDYATELLRSSSKATSDDVAIKKCLEALRIAISKQYPDCSVYPFGSRVTGICNPDSDLDIFVDIGDTYYGEKNQSPKHQQDIVVKVCKILRDDKETFKEIMPITSARTPIIKVVHAPTKIDCDLSFRHGLSIENTKFISFCLELQPRMQPALLVLKVWLDQAGLKEHITSYALCMMFIFYMQLNGNLPSVERLRELTGREFKCIDGWETIDYNLPATEVQKNIIMYKKPIYYLIKGFFDLYRLIDFDNDLICPLMGRTILANKFMNKGENLPDCMKVYKEKLKEGTTTQFKMDAAICLQDPFDLCHNLMKNVEKPIMSRFKKMCGLSSDFMKSNLY